MPGMLRVGLTGGIGAGKTTVANRLREHGAVVIDADAIAREVVSPGTEGLAAVTERFGQDLLTSEGELDRQALAGRAFADESSRQDLNAIMHPRIGARTAELMREAAADAIVVHDVPLLVEGNMGSEYHLVIVVDADEPTRVQRLTDSRGIAEADARARIASQASTAQRSRAADVWLDNSGSPQRVRAAVDSLWAERLVPFEENLRLRRPALRDAARIVDYDPDWPVEAERLRARLHAAVGERAVRIDHIGSTAVPELPAKDVIDLQLIVPTLAEADSLEEVLAEAGFPRRAGEWSDAPNAPARAPEPWEKRFHQHADPGRPANLHVRSCDGPAWWLPLLLRDWLDAHPVERTAYAGHKRQLAELHAADGDTEGYAAAKQPWIDAAFGRAREWAERTAWEARR